METGQSPGKVERTESPHRSARTD